MTTNKPILQETLPCRVSFSCLQSNKQKCSAKQFRGDWLKVAPPEKRQFSAAADSSITYVCIQVKENSLGGFTANDAIVY